MWYSLSGEQPSRSTGVHSFHHHTRQILAKTVIRDCDAPLLTDKQSKWESWKQPLHALNVFHIQCCFLCCKSEKGDLNFLRCIH